MPDHTPFDPRCLKIGEVYFAGTSGALLTLEVRFTGGMYAPVMACTVPHTPEALFCQAQYFRALAEELEARAAQLAAKAGFAPSLAGGSPSPTGTGFDHTLDAREYTRAPLAYALAGVVPKQEVDAHA
jgi:hypothetical protein